MTENRYRMTVSGPTELTVELDAPRAPASPDREGRAEVERVTVIAPTAGDLARGVRRFEAVVEGWCLEVAVEPAARAALRERATPSAAQHQPGMDLALRAQIPGRVVRLWVAEGDEVAQGDRLLAVEAMKMENEIRAPHAGRVSGLRVDLGRLVERGDELLVIS